MDLIFMPRLLYPNTHWVGQRVAPNRSGRYVEEKILLPVPRIESKLVDYTTFSIVTKRAELFCLRPWQKRVFNLHWILKLYFDADDLS